MTFDLDFTDPPTDPPAGNSDRFNARWHFVAAGLSNIWRYGDLDLPAPTGRLLLRGPNGTGKTTALEALWPYLLDLDAAKLTAGKARTTTLKQLMSEGASARGRRYGYAWLTFAPPDDLDEPAYVTYGVRLQYSAGASPAVKVVPFTAPGRPLHELNIKGTNGSALENEEFTARVTSLGGEVFESNEAYVDHFALRVWSATSRQVHDLAQRMRQIRNPALLGDLSPASAADALRDSLPGVSTDVIALTADALAESESTREAFDRDRQAAEQLSDFNRVWTGHVVEVASECLTKATNAAAEVHRLDRALARAEAESHNMNATAAQSKQAAAEIEAQFGAKDAEVRAIEQSDAYLTAGSIKELEARLAAELLSASSTSSALRSAASAAANGTGAARIAIESTVDQLSSVVLDAIRMGANTPPVETLLSHHSLARQIYRVGDTIADPGARLVVAHNDAALKDVSVAWVSEAQKCRAESGTAQMLIKAHQKVEEALASYTAASQALERSESKYLTEQETLTTLTALAHQAADTVLQAIAPWAEQHEELRTVDPEDPTGGSVWSADDVSALVDAEPSEVLASIADWASFALRAAERRAAEHESTARGHAERAVKLEQEATQMRTQARALRDGQLLPFPRPAWAGNGDDTQALGSVLEWQPGVHVEERNNIELALAASGLLSAHLDLQRSEVSTDAWRVSAAGPESESNLTAVLTVDLNHPSADAAFAVLLRIRLADRAVNGGPGLVIGRDGTFAAGVLAASPADPAMSETGAVPAAEFVGARTRRDRALVEADRLDFAASQLEVDAAEALYAADAARAEARAERVGAQSFPDHRPLLRLEAERSGAAIRTQSAKTVRDEDELKVDEAATDHQRLRDEWVVSARSADMPADLEKLADVVTDRRTRADGLDRCVTLIRTIIAKTLPSALRLLIVEEELSTELSDLESRARQALETSLATTALLDEVRSDSDADDAVRRHQEASAARTTLQRSLAKARNLAERDHDAAIEAQAKITPARQLFNAALPEQAETERTLSTLMAWGPVATALDVSGFLSAAGRDPDDGLGAGQSLMESSAALLQGKQTSHRRTLSERYDAVRAEIAQTWTLAHDDAPSGLNVEMYVLTHADELYDPPRAAQRASILSERAQAALADAEAQALQDFVIGRLPSAIGTAWTQMRDWKDAVNAKMRSAQASSGVGVQVRITLRDDLDTSANTVYRLSCEVGNAVRTDEEKRAVGDAITALLAATDGETMADRLASAVDIRSWVDVKYLVERPSEDGTRTSKVWGSRTGLSGGERRLVVLAPMLAAIAAGYDRLGIAGLRLVPLDEVPAEVDERGREGLARYMAELDLDLVCTSYLWDGAPGAWDGIDAHDLEAGSDGTVVAFPTLIRGLEKIPDDLIELATSAED